MRNPENVLISLTKHSNQKDYKYERLYRLLYNEELYLTAYQNIYSNDGSMTKGTDKQTVDGMSIERIRKIIVSLKDESYQPKPARRTYIPKKNGKMRPLGIPSFEDKLLQEVIRMILEAIYEVTTVGLLPQDDYTVNMAQEIPELRERYDIVLHAAGKAHVTPKTKAEKQAFFDVNLQGTISKIADRE